MKDLYKHALYKAISCLLTFVVMFYTIGCQNYFLVTKVPNNNIADIENIGDSNKLIIIHRQNVTYYLNDVTVDSTSVSGILSLPTSTFDYKYLHWDHKYKASDRKNIDAVHVYLTYSHPKLNPGMIKIDSKYIANIDIVEKNTEKTVISHIIGWASISLVVAPIMAAIAGYPVYLGGNIFNR